MSPGQLDRLCTVYTEQTRRLSDGSPETERVPNFQFWAKKEEQGSRAYRAGSADLADVSAVFTTWWDARFKARMQFECEGQRYEIVGPPREQGRRESLLIPAKSIGA